MRITKMTCRGSQTYYRAVEIEDVIGMIKDVKTGEAVSAFRRRWLTSTMQQRRMLERRHTHLLFGGAFLKNRPAVFSGCVLLKFHNIKDSETMNRLREVLASGPNTLLAMEGAKARSFVAVVHYTRPDGTLPTDERRMRMFLAHAYRHAVSTFEPLVGCAVTLIEPELHQDCLLSYDAAVYYNPHAVSILLEQPVSMPEETVYLQHYEGVAALPESELSLYSKHRFCATQFDAALAQALTGNAEALEKGDFKPLLTATARQCFKSGIEEEECVQWSMLFVGHFVDEMEIRGTIANVYSMERGFGEAPLVNSVQLQSMRLDEFMRRRYELRYNTMTGSPECRERHSFCFEFVPVDVRKLNSLVLNAQAEGIDLWNRDMVRYVQSDRVPNYRPIEDYLNRLPTWDGRDRIRPLMGRVKCNNVRWVEFAYRWFLSMVAHWQGRDEEHGNALSPLLVGGQGYRKSTFCKSLLPPELQMYYTDSIDFSRKRDAELSLTRFALINLDEFDQTNERHQAFLKYLLQTSVVSTRKPYGTQVEAMKRYASFIGTSNHTDLLNDLSGSRRFLCVEVMLPIDMSQPIDYAQLYAQAVAALDNGERYWLTFEEEQALTKDNEQFRQHSLSEDLFFRYYRVAESEGEGCRMTAGEIYEQLCLKSGIRLPQSKKNYFGRFLKKTVSLITVDRRGTLYRVAELATE